MSSSADSKIERFTFLWAIENFHLLPQQNENYLISPTFNIKTFKNTKWSLKLYPKGSCEDDLEYVSCFLKREIDDDGPLEIKINLRLSLNLNSVAFVSTGAYENGETRGYQKFISLECVKEFPNNYFIIEACMELVENMESITDCIEQKLLPLVTPFFKRTELPDEMYSALESQYEKVQKDLWICPSHCFAKTQVLVERRSIFCSLGNLLQPKSSKNIKHIPIISFSKVPSLLITLRKAIIKDEEYLDIDITLIDNLNEHMPLSCNISLLTANGECRKSFEGIYIFSFGCGKDVWRFEDSIKLSTLNNREDITIMHLNFVFSKGQIISNIEWTSDVDTTLLKDANSTTSTVLSELYRFYTEEKFCNVILQTGDRTFKAHKAILCAASPVFSAMFESGMKESETNVIQIDDIDSETLNKMLEYIYTERIEQCSLNLAINLYSAADKYALESLKLMCRCYLKNNLNAENLCEILLFADAHHDNQIKELAINFLSLHKKNILLSKEWEELSNKNLLFANKILLALCLL